MDVYKRLEEKINELIERVKQLDTEDVLGYIGAMLFAGKTGNLFELTGLSSPIKQLLYLGGLLLSTPEPQTKIEFNEKRYNELTTLLEEIANTYSLLFFPDEEEMKQGLSEQWKKSREVTMPVFLHYFNTVSLSYEEQQLLRIEKWFLPFNEQVEQEVGVSVQDILEWYSFVKESFKKPFENTKVLNDQYQKEIINFFETASKEGLGFEEIMPKITKTKATNLALQLVENVSLLFHISIDDMKQRFGEEKSNRLIEIFSIKREQRDFRYYTEKNPFEIAPLWRKSPNYLMCLEPKLLLNAIYDFLYSVMESSQYKNSWYKRRDIETENQTVEIIRGLFGNQAEYFTSVFENDKSQNEHDVLVIYKDTILIVEVKASKFKEPFRDPDKAYVRIKRDFRSDGGIQKAFEQGLNLKKLLLSNDSTNLYNQKGEVIKTIYKEDIKNVFIICLTAEDTGIVGTNLSLLLEKPEDEPFPWACNLYDFSTLIDAFIYKKLSPEKFIEYLSSRQRLHERFLSTDELEIAGFYLRYGSFQQLEKSSATHYFLTPDMSDIFDEIYFEKNGVEFETDAYCQHDEFLDKFIDFLEANGWHFGGGTKADRYRGE
ncbi:hypothetical protein [Parageobacillus toebii]|jgi:hypothetical protein|uniref:hypothetical protein n=1 Tax=Parageobacillus toebii TaxID=153151 RepID=UPI0019682D62|nr:hypothetical protein [Parageobacillus toebii]MED4991018.1 hypothetical protein [Parageobacillus toebii]QSB50558.1 hypothetical protein JTI59_11345 [Parageobacillus toebii]